MNKDKKNENEMSDAGKAFWLLFCILIGFGLPEGM